jgi:hypothetical protein
MDNGSATERTVGSPESCLVNIAGTMDWVWIICSGHKGPQGGKITYRINRWRRPN